MWPAICLSSIRIGAPGCRESFRSGVLVRVLLAIQHLLHKRARLLLVRE